MNLPPLFRAPVLAAGTAAALLLPATTSAQIVVCQSGTGNTTTIQAAIDMARPGDEIVVCPGTYAEAIDLRGKAVHLRSQSGAAVTIIDASGLGTSAVSCTSFEGPNTIIDGFTITGGSGTPSQTTPVDTYGGGLYARFSNPTIVRCTFRANTADLGGGMLTFQAPRTKLIECVFDTNSARLGGGLFNNGSSVRLEDATFINNTAQITGGGFHSTQGSAEVEEGIFTGNQAGFDGGGMYNALNASSITETDFVANTAGFDGGGLYNWSSTSLVDECEFRNNSAGRGGGMINFSAQPTITNSLFEGNSANEGGAMFSWSSAATLAGLSLCANNATLTGGAMHVSAGNDDMRNSILWGNSAGQGAEIFLEPRSRLRVSSSDIRGCGGSGPGWVSTFGTDMGGNLDADPAFRSPSTGDLHLTSSSPCIDAGRSPLVPAVVTLDLDRNPRFFDDPGTPNTGLGTIPVDMGAYEFGSTTLPWLDLGFGLAGINGQPVLIGGGTLEPAQPLTLALSRAAGRAPVALIIGGSRLDAPILGGTLVPWPNLVLPLLTNRAGNANLAMTWPANAPSATTLYFQAWISDAVGPFGFAASNGLAGVSP